MEKKISEDEFLELEQEIDSAVDRLFRHKVELQEGMGEDSFLEPTALVEPRVSSPKAGTLEELEAQLLQLEWEVTPENLRRTEQEVKALKQEFKENGRILSVLRQIEGLLARMIEKGGAVPPSWMKFLLDAKEAMKFLIKPVEGPHAPYQQLLCEGLEARATLLLSSVTGLQQTVSPPLAKGAEDEVGSPRWKRLEELAEVLRTASEKMERIISRMEGLLARMENVKAEPEKIGGAEQEPLQVTVFKARGKLYGVENERISKVFRVPEVVWAKYGRARRIRIKDQEVRLIDLGELFPIERKEGADRGERMLLVRENEEHIAFRIEEVLRRISAAPFRKAELSPSPVIGYVRWRFDNRPVEIPVLDLGKL